MPRPRALPRAEVAQHVLGDLRIGDLSTFLAVHRTGTVSAAARELDVTTSQVSKAVRRIERALQRRLLFRGARGVTLTDAGRRVLPRIAGAVERLGLIAGADEPVVTDLNVAAPSYLMEALLPLIVRDVKDLQVHCFELPPPRMRALLADGVFDVALVPGGLRRAPSTWSSTYIGEIRLGLLGTPAVARRLGKQPVSVDEVRRLTFISPHSIADGQYMPADDDCPLPKAERRIGHEAQTLPVAIELAAQTGCVVFGPILAARRLLKSKALTEIRVRGWDVKEPLYLTCNGDRVLARVQAAVVRALRGAFEEVVRE